MNRPARLPLGPILATLALLLALPAAHAQWKWRDKDGRVQYSDRPPPAGVPEKDVLQRPSSNVRVMVVPPAPVASATPAAAPSPAAKASDPALEAKRKQAEAAEAEKRKAEEAKEAKARADNCQRLRGYARALEDGQRVSRTNAQGEREFLDDRQRGQELARTRELMGQDCR